MALMLHQGLQAAKTISLMRELYSLPLFHSLFAKIWFAKPAVHIEIKHCILDTAVAMDISGVHKSYIIHFVQNHTALCS